MAHSGELMKRITAILLTLVLLLPAFAQAQTDVVAQAKQDLVSRGVSIDGACGALRITNLVAWRLRPQYGLLHKAGGNRAILKADGSCLTGEQSNDPEGYATDYVIDRATGYGFDLLGDGGGANNPQWAGPENAPDMVSRNWSNYREPVDPAGYYGALPVPTPVPPPVVVPPAPIPSVDLTPILTQQAIDHAAEMALLQELRTQMTVLKGEVEDFQAQVRSKYVAVMDSPIVRYGLAAVTGWLLTKAASK